MLRKELTDFLDHEFCSITYFFSISGVYLPLLWEPSFCSRSPIALGYTRGHFCALVPPEPVVGQTLAIRTCSTMSGAACSIQGKYDFDT